MILSRRPAPGVSGGQGTPPFAFRPDVVRQLLGSYRGWLVGGSPTTMFASSTSKGRHLGEHCSNFLLWRLHAAVEWSLVRTPSAACSVAGETHSVCFGVPSSCALAEHNDITWLVAFTMQMVFFNARLVAIISISPSIVFGLAIAAILSFTEDGISVFRARIKLKKMHSKNCYTKLILCSNLHFCVAIFSVMQNHRKT